MCLIIPNSRSISPPWWSQVYSLYLWICFCFVCCCSVAQYCPTLCNLWTAACQPSLSFTISWTLLKLISIELVKPSNYLFLHHLLLLLPSIFPSSGVFSNESALTIRCPKFWSFSISPSNEYSGLTSFRIDWLALLAVQRTLRSLCNTTDTFPLWKR